MTDELCTWLEERETIHGKAPGETWGNYGTPRFEVYDQTEYDDGDMGEMLADSFSLPVAEAIVDAHNTLPNLLAGVRAVLELHKPTLGPWFTSEKFCEECSAPLFKVWVNWPCSTIDALQEAINDDE